MQAERAQEGNGLGAWPLQALREGGRSEGVGGWEAFLRHHLALEQQVALQRRALVALREALARQGALLRSVAERAQDLEARHRVLASRYSALMRTVATLAEERKHPVVAVTLEERERWFQGTLRLLGLDPTRYGELLYLHEVGLLKLPPDLLMREQTLTPQERRLVAEHCRLGMEVCQGLGLPEELVRAVRHHHENYDGSGYPDHLEGEAIPLLARVLRVLEVYTALVSPRPHRPPLPHEEAVRHLQREAGRSLDPRVVEAFLQVVEKPHSQRMRDFLSAVSHELRGPLTALVGFSELLAHQRDLPPQASARAREIHQEATRLARMVEELLDLSRLESGRLPVRSRPTDLLPLLRSALEQARLRTDRHTLRLEAPPSLPPALADPDRVRQVVDNLLENALRYSPQGGPVLLRVEVRGDCLAVTVEDRGIGIPPEYQERVFEPFFRVPQEEVRRVPGTGLGLALCKNLVEAMGGEISLFSRPGQGTRVTFTLPRAG